MLQWLDLCPRNKLLTRHSYSSSPIGGCCCCKQVKNHNLVSAFGSHFIFSCALHLLPLFMLQKVTHNPGRGGFNSPVFSQKKEASLMAVYKSARLVKVLELHLHDCHEVTEMNELRSCSCSSSCNQCGWSDTKFMCWTKTECFEESCSAAPLQPQSRIPPWKSHLWCRGVTVLQHQLSFQSGWAGFDLVGFNTIYILMAFTTAV